MLTAAGIGLATAALRLHDPHQHGSWGLCPFKALTGWDCPLCGGLRGVNDLSRGHVVEAWHSNALFISLVPLIALAWMAALGRAWTGSAQPVPARASRCATTVLVVVALAFTVYRNTPAGAALHVT